MVQLSQSQELYNHFTTIVVKNFLLAQVRITTCGWLAASLIQLGLQAVVGLTLDKNAALVVAAAVLERKAVSRWLIGDV